MEMGKSVYINTYKTTSDVLKGGDRMKRGDVYIVAVSRVPVYIGDRVNCEKIAKKKERRAMDRMRNIIHSKYCIHNIYCGKIKNFSVFTN